MGTLHALEDLEPLFKFPIHLSVRKSRENYRQMYGKSKASLWRNLSIGTPPKFFRTILCFVALVYNWYFFQNSLLVKTASKTVTRSIFHGLYFIWLIREQNCCLFVFYNNIDSFWQPFPLKFLGKLNVQEYEKQIAAPSHHFYSLYSYPP